MMTFSDIVSLQKYVDSANREFDESQRRLSRIENSFQARTNGKTPGTLVKNMFGTVCWLVAFCIFAWYVKEAVGNMLTLAYLLIAVALVIALFVDEIIDYSYCRKIFAYKADISRLKNRLSLGKSSIVENQDAFMQSCHNNWNFPIPNGKSISEETDLIESSISGIEFLKTGLINNVKNCLFAALVIAVTGAGSWALFGIAEEMVTGILGESIDSDLWESLCIIGVIVTEIGEIILAKMCWSNTACSVTNITLLIVPFGPALFLILAVAIACIILFLAVVVGLVISIATVVIGCICLFGSISGG